MSLLEPLAVPALLGTRKQQPEALVFDGELGALLKAIAQTPATAEARLLRAAAVLDTCQHAGWIAPDAATTAVPPAPLDTLPLPPAESFALLAQVFVDGYERLSQSVLLLLAERQLRLPPQVLPDLLDKARRNSELRNLLAPVLGERGRWLAERNPAWQVQAVDHAAPLDDAVWQTGSLERRAVYLSLLRGRDPVAGRELLDSSRKELDARERTALLRALATGLSLDDEPLLETFRAERSKEVRRVAVELLALLPGSAYRQRMSQRLAQCVSLVEAEPAPGGLKGLLKRFVQTVASEPAVRIEPPEVFFAEGKDDQLEEALPNGEELGQRAWWLYQVVAASPLQAWQSYAGLTPTEWVSLASHTDWDQALMRGWYQACLREGNAQWAAALLERLSPDGTYLARSYLDGQPLIALLPINERERYWLHMAASANANPDRAMGLSELLALIIAAVPVHAPPSAAFCRQLLPHLTRWISHPRSAYDYNLRQTLRDFATLLPLNTFAEARQGWPSDETLTSHQAQALNDWQRTLTLRENLQQLLD